MLTIQDLKDKFEIQGAYRISTYNDDTDEVETLAEGHDFECEWHDIKEEYMNDMILYMFAVDGVLNIEIAYKTYW